jgi:hypothetical protein
VSHLQAKEIQENILLSAELLSSYIKEFNADVVLFSADKSFDLKMQKSDGCFTVFCEAAQRTDTSIVVVSLQGALVIDSSGKRITQKNPKEVYFNVNDVSCHACCVLDNKNFNKQVRTVRNQDVMCLFVLDSGNLPEQELQTCSESFQMYIVSVQRMNLLAANQDVKTWTSSPGASSRIIDSNGKEQGKTSKNGKFAKFTAHAGKMSRPSSASDDGKVSPDKVSPALKVSPDGKVSPDIITGDYAGEEISNDNGAADNRALRRRSRSAGSSGVMIVPLNDADAKEIDANIKKKQKKKKKNEKNKVKVVPTKQNTPGITAEEKGTKTKEKKLKIDPLKKAEDEKARKEKSLARRASRINISGNSDSVVHI